MHMATAEQRLSNIPHTTLTRYGELDRPTPDEIDQSTQGTGMTGGKPGW